MRNLVAAAIVALALPLRAGNTVVLLPVDNVSGDDRAPAEIVRLMTSSIEKSGWRVVSGDAVEPQLEQQHVRYLDSVDAPVCATLLQAAGGDALVTTSVYTWRDGDNPTVALSARMIRADGTLAWAEVIGLSADDTEELLGLGRDATPQTLAARVVSKLMRHFPNASQESALTTHASQPLFLRRPSTFFSGELDPKTPHRVCILPFDNRGTTPEATRVVGDLFAMRLAAANGFDVIEPATLRAAALKANIASFRSIASEHLKKLAAIVGTPLFLRGTIFSYRDAGPRAAAGLPAIEIEMELVDVSTDRVIWTAMHTRKGSDYVGFLMRGMVSNAVALTDRMVGEFVVAEQRAAANAPSTPPAVPTRAASLRKGGNR